ncbi:5,10-methylenetetrahydrofolate dehydrogenase and methenyltetrahydrofolate cyclohydrolase [Syntrophotalea carbinolica DSM 2380]|uniref:Bifunctional protein FolD n=1 Tax=Syntrophotalea carbinolica (strain DSM 2380 / NBRC 103641 / GraBd1) TaxID=338963 RepID=FOLD_SYNC1|nr:tetrahydrofolate dehydrogenase/cyclohydrolase catalytic domain-containing protein [Syntrophotalea carbinolica]Q3A1Q7.1 RecName: Full=Bifunctional protein FolD; Includes: RecName: Full=Methylenetetrahydrofolate dehydrogenase; Includes: RecName: Full=Methenyltetrahydrofolate cyclohydrolase [Syntrophotalea carbinolica DSM 2380]ABA89700.1 5,10-methylenetetrahydrofolate dehydrogenase and methenyltetrahydrofolate cyclohydrolase [Syntrophotalea carbinolica DSM 2380]
MSAQLLEGKVVAAAVLEDVARRVAVLKDKGISPGLGTILVGDDGPSVSYVNKKRETCKQVGIASFHNEIPASATQSDLLAAVRDFNDSPDVDAYIIQYPLPKGFDFNEALNLMLPEKDADGLHPVNLGRLVLQEPGPVPCTPAGIRAMLQHYDIAIEGKEVVVIGRGPTLGRPLSLLLTLKQPYANAAVTVVHSGIKDLGAYTRRADIVIAAAGCPGIVQPDMIRPGAVVISGGISWEGRKLLPDVDEAVGEVAGWITPRLGGVGPTTVAMLLLNTVQAAEERARRAGKL